MPTSRGPYRGAELEDLARIIEGKQKSAAVSRGFLGLLLDKWLISNGLADPEQFPDEAALETPAALVDKGSERPSSTLKVAQKLDRIARCSDQLSQLLSDGNATIGLHSHIRLAIKGRKAKESTSDAVRNDVEAGRFLKDLRDRLALLRSAAEKRKKFLESGRS